MSEIKQNPERRIALFQRKEIRRTIHNDEWWFVVEDVVLALIESRDPKQYIQRMKQRDPELGKGWVQIVHTLSVPTEGGPQPMLCANTEGLFRIIQSVPSPKAEPFKRWLARVGYERVQEIEDPELATKRARVLYKAKGYSDDWIEKRMRSIAIRDELTGEWKKRGVKEQREYAILTAEITERFAWNGEVGTFPIAGAGRVLRLSRAPRLRLCRAASFADAELGASKGEPSWQPDGVMDVEFLKALARNPKFEIRNEFECPSDSIRNGEHRTSPHGF
jgi:hypothetical protein